ncbi:MAG: hypothetical protein KIS88_09615 [Anaerolineales bacterium]|nr:hypothetical protein [Anaerolineales bacterium]
MLDDADLNLPSEQPDPEPPRRSGGRNFLAVAGVLGGLMLLALIALAVYALVILPGQRAAEEPEVAQATATQLVQAQQPSNTPTNTLVPTRTATATRTPVPPTATSTPVTPLFTTNPEATQTVEALLTQAALAQAQAAATTDPDATATSAPTATPSALPQSGLADDIGGPGMLALGSALLLAIIVMARRLRAQH